MSRLRPTIVRAVSALSAFAALALAVPAHADGPVPPISSSQASSHRTRCRWTPPAPLPRPHPRRPRRRTKAHTTRSAPTWRSRQSPPSLPAPAVADDDPRALGEFPATRPVRFVDHGPELRPGMGSGFERRGIWILAVPPDGHWAADASGSQVWMSDYPFGDVVFHYGRWVWISAGWAWIPGYRYAPAWVAWRVPTDGVGYYGWAPLPPSFVWVNQAPVGLPWRSSYYWVFCPSNFVHSATPASYIVRSPAEAQAVRLIPARYAASPRRTHPRAGAVARRAAGAVGARDIAR